MIACSIGTHHFVSSTPLSSFSTVSITKASLFFFSRRRRHTRSTRDWSSDVCSSDLPPHAGRWRGALLPGAAADHARVPPRGRPRERDHAYLHPGAPRAAGPGRSRLHPAHRLLAQLGRSAAGAVDSRGLAGADPALRRGLAGQRAAEPRLLLPLPHHGLLGPPARLTAPTCSPR